MAASLNYDGITLESLRTREAVKWTKFKHKIGAFVAEMDFGTAPSITEALQESVSTHVLGYLTDELKADLSKAVSSWQSAEYGWSVEPSYVKQTVNVLNGLKVAINHYSVPGSAVIVPTPAYMPFLRIPKECGRRVIQVPLVTDPDGNYTFDYDGLDKAFKDGGNLLILCNPYNPVGRVFRRHELESLCEVVARNNGRVFSDEIHAPLVYEGHAHIPYASLSAESASHTVTATSASKGWNIAGLKCAQLILSNERDLQHWDTEGHFSQEDASTPGVIANTVAFTRGNAWRDTTLSYLASNRDFLSQWFAENLPGISYKQPEGTYIAWLDARRLGLNNPAEYLRDNANVALTDGATCGEGWEGYMRLVFATPRPVLETLMKYVTDAVSSR